MTGYESGTDEGDEGFRQHLADLAYSCLHKPRHWVRLLRARVHGPWIRVGDFYEDCSFHVRVCTVSNMCDDHIAGISVIDAHGPSGCSPSHCGVIKVSAQTAMEAQRDPRDYFTRSMAQFGIPAEKLPQAVDDAVARLNEHRRDFR
jgi:hypothetical protein